MLMFGIMGIAALVIDIGFARLTQMQMQSAADSVALEGLRGSNSITTGERDANATKLARITFDENLDAVDTDAGNAGAGPAIAFSGSVGDPSLSAGQIISVDEQSLTYKPDLQSFATANPETIYQVSMQRGGRVDGTANLASVGPSVPYLFARGSLVSRELIGRGITVRADSTAETRPALLIGLPVYDSEGVLVYPGANGVGFHLDDWNGNRQDPRAVNVQGTSSPEVPTRVGQLLVDTGPSARLDGYCCIYDELDGSSNRYVIGFAALRNGQVQPNEVVIANATASLSSVWSKIDPSIRSLVIAALPSNEPVGDFLRVAHPKALR